jgi:hypothetical protein
MSRSSTKQPEKSRGPNLLHEFDNSLPDFKNIDEEQHLKFVKAIRMICAYYNVSEARLQRDDYFRLRPAIVRLSQLYEEYHVKDAILASAILIVKLHIESHYLDGQEAKLVHNLTGLHTYPLTLSTARSR